jgi:hypothetical protein
MISIFEIGFLQLFHRNDHHIETKCRSQHLGRHLEGHGHSMTLKQNCVRPITSLFEVGFLNYFIEMITILGRCVAHNICVATLKVNVTAWLFSKSCPAHYLVILSRIFKLFHRNDHYIEQNCVQSITSFFEVGILQLFHRYDQHNEKTCHVQHLVATLKVKVKAWSCCKIMSGP